MNGVAVATLRKIWYLKWEGKLFKGSGSKNGRVSDVWLSTYGIKLAMIPCYRIDCMDIITWCSNENYIWKNISTFKAKGFGPKPEATNSFQNPR